MKNLNKIASEILELRLTRATFPEDKLRRHLRNFGEVEYITYLNEGSLDFELVDIFGSLPIRISLMYQNDNSWKLITHTTFLTKYLKLDTFTKKIHNFDELVKAVKDLVEQMLDAKDENRKFAAQETNKLTFHFRNSIEGLNFHQFITESFLSRFFSSKLIKRGFSRIEVTKHNKSNFTDDETDDIMEYAEKYKGFLTTNKCCRIR